MEINRQRFDNLCMQPPTTRGGGHVILRRDGVALYVTLEGGATFEINYYINYLLPPL